MTVPASYQFITKKEFRLLVESLIENRAVYGTTDRDGFPAYDAIESYDELKLFRKPTHLSAKQYLFPQREPLVRFDVEKGGCEPVVEASDQVIIGLHSCDVHALRLMDGVFAYGIPDANYLERRSKTMIIATGCFPDSFCFCTSVNTDTVDEGFDLFVHELKRGFLVRTGTEAGSELLGRFSPREPTAREIDELRRGELERRDAFSTRLEADWKLLPSIYARSGSSPVWDKIGSICYGCGSCNNVCPTCYCFDVRDEVSANLKTVERVRTWDACTLEDFAKVAGGHNFRRSRSDRLRHRFNRKFNYLAEKFDSLFCVGCGRCSRTCLVKINIAEVTNELIREAARK